MRDKKPHPIELESFWPYRIAVLADQIGRYTLRIAKEKAGLNLSQWRVLAAVAEQPGRTAAQVTEITPMDKTIVSRAVSSLIAHGFLTKKAKQNDKKRMQLTPTKAGYEAYSSIATHLQMTLVDGASTASQHKKMVSLLDEYRDHMNRLGEDM